MPIDRSLLTVIGVGTMSSEENITADGVGILIVEDSPTQAMELQLTLERHGYLTSVAGDGREALQWLSRNRPAMVISDIIMPELDGYELCRAIRKDERLKGLPVILLSCLSDAGDVLKGLESGASNFIVKPYNADYLLSYIHEELSARRRCVGGEDQPQPPVAIEYGGCGYLIRTGVRQILDILLATYGTAVRKSEELIEAETELLLLNEHLEEKVRERTAALTAEIAERRRVEEELRKKSEELKVTSNQLWQSAKLATMGELTASIAHELNNPLATISLRVETLLSEAGAESPERRLLLIIDQEVDRMADLVANLLQFSRRCEQQISTLDLCDEISKTLELIHYHLIKHNITVVQDFAPDLPQIHADRQQLRQVFLNLFTNASDAMPKGGALTIRGSATILSGEDAVHVKICDTGVGIAPETLSKVMEPFFTTKPEGKGTGMGLSICRRIVQEHGGILEVSSELNKGTTIGITIPTQSKVNGEIVRED